MIKYSKFNSTPYETHLLVFNRISAKSKVLDVGCASGFFAKEVSKKDCQTWGIEWDEKAAKLAKKYCQKVIIGDVEKMERLPFSRNYFDYVLLLDVIEHLRNPQAVINIIKLYINKNGKIIISTPNIAFISIRIALFFGRFNYQKMGIMDESHVHFYTKKTLVELIKQCGLKIAEMDTASGFSQITRIGKYLNRIPKYWQYKITKLWDTLLGYQFIVICTVR